MPDDILLARKHATYAARVDQLTANLACYAGGAPYINLRLTRFPCEPEVSWSGQTLGRTTEGFWSNATITGVQGRKDRAFLINYAARIVTKYQQFIFGQDVTREGIAPDFERNATRTRLGINGTMRRLAGLVHAGQWAWLGVDRLASKVDPATGKPTLQSMAEKEERGDRVYWTLYPSTAIIDWEFDHNGEVAWLITEHTSYTSPDPRKPAEAQMVRTLWEPGRYTRLQYKVENNEPKLVQEMSGQLSARTVPFIPVGDIEPVPYWFDDAERIQASLLNLDSAHHENLISSVYPQLVIPHELVRAVMEAAGVDYNGAVQMVRGLNYPILEPAEAKGLTRFITPAASDLEAIPREIGRRRQQLFEVAGIGLQNKESRQQQSAESKAWDYLDTEATLREYAQLWQTTEEKAIELSRQIDSTFKGYTPKYPADFDIGDVKEQMETLLMLQNLDLPAEAQKELARAAVTLQHKINRIPPDTLATIMDEIDKMDTDKLAEMVASMTNTKPPPRAQPGDNQGPAGAEDSQPPEAGQN